MKKKKILFFVIPIILIIILLSILLFGNKKNVEVVSKNKNILKIDGKEFKDLNSNNKLDIYEDWRLSSEKRADDLISKMTLEEKAGMVLANTQYSATSQKDKEKINGLLSESTSVEDNRNYFNYVGNTETIKDLNIRHIMVYEEFNNINSAKWMNSMNELAESTRLGIPIEFIANLSSNSKKTLYDGKTNDSFTLFPSTLGIASSSLGEIKKNKKTSIPETYAEIVKRENLAYGFRKAHFFSADITTDPRWIRNNETLGEDVDFIKKYLPKMIRVAQAGKSLNSESLALTVKHFPGSGARDNGLDSHYEFGKNATYLTENSLSKYHLVTFAAAIDAGVSSVMPYYSVPDNNSASQKYKGLKIKMDGDAFVFNKFFINDLLRDKMDFDGVVTSDSGATFTFAWGKKNLSEEERIASALNAGTDIIVDTNHVESVLKAIDKKYLKEETLNNAVKRLLIEMFDLGLFENPYVEELNENIVTKSSNETAFEIHQKSVVLLKNNDVLPIKKKNVKIYLGNYGVTSTIMNSTMFDKNVKIVKDYNEADYFISFIEGTTDNNNVYIVDIEKSMKKYDEWNKIATTVRKNGGKTITIVNMQTPYAIDALDKNSDVILASFNTHLKAIFSVIFGKFKPVGVLPFTLPNKEATVIDRNGVSVSPNDVPGYDKNKYMNGKKYEYVDTNKNAYILGFGLSY